MLYCTGEFRIWRISGWVGWTFRYMGGVWRLCLQNNNKNVKIPVMFYFLMLPSCHITPFLCILSILSRISRLFWLYEEIYTLHHVFYISLCFACLPFFFLFFPRFLFFFFVHGSDFIYSFFSLFFSFFLSSFFFVRSLCLHFAQFVMPRLNIENEIERKLYRIYLFVLLQNICGVKIERQHSNTNANKMWKWQHSLFSCLWENKLFSIWKAYTEPSSIEYVMLNWWKYYQEKRKNITFFNLLRRINLGRYDGGMRSKTIKLYPMWIQFNVIPRRFHW